MTTAHREQRLARAALEALDYRAFLAGALAVTVREGGRLNIAAFSRKAGFSSRSFIGDVIDGRRRLSAKSYPKLTRALSLPQRIKSYFHLLVIREENELNFEGLKPEQIDSKLSELRAKLTSQLEKAETERAAASTLFKGRDLLDCYAALGAPDAGATLESITFKTRLPEETCVQALQFLLERGVVFKRDDRYFAGNSLFFVNGLGDDQGLKACYVQSLEELKRKANVSFNAAEHAFFQFVYSIDRSRMTELKARLWELMQEFVESTERSEGDGIAKLVLGFYV